MEGHCTMHKGGTNIQHGCNLRICLGLLHIWLSYCGVSLRLPFITVQFQTVHSTYGLFQARLLYGPLVDALSNEDGVETARCIVKGAVWFVSMTLCTAIGAYLVRQPQCANYCAAEQSSQGELFHLGWRRNLSKVLTQKYMSNLVFYDLQCRPSGPSIDNPDQRICAEYAIR